MAVLSTNEEIAGRFAPYVNELHELFGLHGVPFGAPADLPAFVDRLDSGGAFPEDVSSILRSIILREGGNVPQTELLEVIALAAGGRELDPSAPEVQPSFRRLLSFVGTVARRPWNMPPGDPAPTGAAAGRHAAAQTRQDASLQQLPDPSQSAPPPNFASAERGPDQAGSAPAHDSAIPRGFRPFAPRPATDPAEPAAADHIPPPDPHSGRGVSLPLWIAAGCAILALLLLIVFDRTHPPAGSQTVVSTAPVSGSAAPSDVASAAGAAQTANPPQTPKPSAATVLPDGRQPAASSPRPGGTGTSSASAPYASAPYAAPYPATPYAAAAPPGQSGQAVSQG
ncbi:MAG: hypothetical protein M3O02_06615, partial [Acidobacteriota bacterium]|nr:hypothetical protein [Acidobacteriota bacterium]